MKACVRGKPINKTLPGIWTTLRGITATIWERLSGRSFRLLTLHCNNSLRGVQCAWMLYCNVESWTLIHSWERRPPVPSPSFKAIGKQLSKLLEAVQDVLPTPRVALLFTSIHNQFLSRWELKKTFNNQSANPRVGDKLKQAGLVPDNSPTHGLVLSELIFYRENLRFMSVS